MYRSENIYYRVVNSENSMTELLCNYMAYKPFRDLFLHTFISADEIGNFQYNDFQTQLTLDINNCRPDITVTNEDYEILIEVKTENSGLTENQPITYLQHLQKSQKENTYLIFLIPYGYSFENQWCSEIDHFSKQFPNSKITTKIIYWNDLIHFIQKSELFRISEKVNDFYELLKMWFEIEKVTFSTLEVDYMFKPEIPKVLIKLFEIVDAVKNYTAKNYKSRITSNSIEHCIYFQDENKEYTLFFGIWYDFWQEHGVPLCYGIDENWGSDKLASFQERHEQLIKKDGYYLTTIDQEVLGKDCASEEIARLIFNELEYLMKIS